MHAMVVQCVAAIEPLIVSPHYESGCTDRNFDPSEVNMPIGRHGGNAEQSD